MKKILMVAAVCLFLFSITGYTQNLSGTLHYSLRCMILASDPEQTSNTIAVWVEERGGYFLYTSPDIMMFRLPADSFPDLRKFLEDESDALLEYSPQAMDLQEEIVNLQSGIQSREEILEKNLSYIDKTDVAGTLAIEKEVTQLLTEIESMKGRLNKLLVDTRFAYGEISLSFYHHSIPESVPSSFEWINTIDFFSFIQGGVW